jgi:2-oxoisovalerate dehydrogenase E2 component (dihydrolipoyl transacylase)
VTKEDVLQFVEEGLSTGAGRTGEETSVSGRSAPAVTLPGTDEIEEPLTPLRKIIADNMTRSASEIPSAWSMVEVDVSGLVACRDAHKEAVRHRAGAPLTYLPFVLKAATEALLEFPRLNSRWGGDRIFLKQRVNIGVAVATDNGLVVPVVHDADSLTVTRLASSIHELAERARGGTLKLDDVQNGTFTVNNTGALGSVVSYPIINYPQAAILTTEAIIKRPVVTDSDAIVVRSMMNVTFAFDHRICDGAEAGDFLATLKRRLEAITADTPID